MTLEQKDKLILDELLKQLQGFEEDLKKERPLIFHSDPKKDKKEIKKYINAFKLVIKYFT